MASPRSKRVWFRHDVGTMNDKKMVRVLRMFGMEGIGIYWYLVEALYEADGYLSFEYLEEFAFSTHVEQEKIIKIIKNSGLFTYDKTQFWSERALKEIGIFNDKSEKARRAINKRWENVQSVTDKEDKKEQDIRTYNDSITDEQHSNNVPITQTDRQTDKQRERGENKPPPPLATASLGVYKNVFMSKSQINELANLFGMKNTHAYIDKLSSYMKINGKSYRDHYAVVRKWMMDDKVEEPYVNERDPLPKHCDKCGELLVDGRCKTCNRAVFVSNGKVEFCDLADPSEFTKFIPGARSS